MNLKHVYILSFAGLLASLCPTASLAGDFVTFPAPNSLNSSEGNSAANFPFSGATVSMRYQQVFETVAGAVAGDRVGAGGGADQRRRQRHRQRGLQCRHRGDRSDPQE